ncbi:undecaprenyl-diphosphatase UppP [Candidatus Kaiserbacteria bacterium]|nr:undecaprenyl-diphosphatase UppP [Candidatus Kaiserbacteria bacterium]
MTFIEAIVLGVVQGLTEFLPVSSTGHLILVQELFNITGSGLAFDAILHLATASAVLFYFWGDVVSLGHTILRMFSRLPVNPKDKKLLYAIIVGSIPAVFFGLLLEDIMEQQFRSAVLVAGVLVAGSILFMYAEWIYYNQPRYGEMSVMKGFKIGLFQALALIPGMSRSGATIAGGMLLGFSREEAARFAFLLAIPIIFGAGSKKLLDLIQSSDQVAWGAVAVGAVAAFITGLLAVHFMLKFVKSHSLWTFIWYRIILASFVLFIVFFG